MAFLSTDSPEIIECFSVSRSLERSSGGPFNEELLLNFDARALRRLNSWLESVPVGDPASSYRQHHRRQHFVSFSRAVSHSHRLQRFQTRKRKGRRVYNNSRPNRSSSARSIVPLCKTRRDLGCFPRCARLLQDGQQRWQRYQAQFDSKKAARGKGDAVTLADEPVSPDGNVGDDLLVRNQLRQELRKATSETRSSHI